MAIPVCHDEQVNTVIDMILLMQQVVSRWKWMTQTASCLGQNSMQHSEGVSSGLTLPAASHRSVSLSNLDRAYVP